MPPSRETRRPTRSRRWLLPAVIGVLSLLAGDRARAVTVTAARGFDAIAHRHDCRCKTCRGESCCCGRDTSHGKSEVRTIVVPEPRQTSSAAGPCIGAAPCGGESGLPDTPSGGSVGKAAQATIVGLDPCTRGRLIPISPSGRLPLRNPSRLEDPPKRIG